MQAQSYDKVTRASTNGIYIKALELDRGQNKAGAPLSAPAGMADDTSVRASSYACSHASTHSSTHASTRATSHASTHASSQG